MKRSLELPNSPTRTVSPREGPVGGGPTVQFCSDLHLENCGEDPIDFSAIIRPEAKILALLGDIGYPAESHYEDFLAYCSKNFQHVFVITGNHEYYSRYHAEMKDIDDLIDHICSGYPNVKFLNRRSEVIGNHRFIGATLWSEIPEEHSEYLTNYMSDYRMIYRDGKPLTTKASTELHHSDLGFIKTELASATQHDQVAIVLTHHTPIMNGTSGPKYANSLSRYAFGTDLQFLFTARLRYWLCGHTHYNFNITIGETTVTSNQRGNGFVMDTYRNRVLTLD